MNCDDFLIKYYNKSIFLQYISDYFSYFGRDLKMEEAAWTRIGMHVGMIIYLCWVTKKKKEKNLGFSRLKTQTSIYYVMFLRREIGLIEIISWPDRQFWDGVWRVGLEDLCWILEWNWKKEAWDNPQLRAPW